MSETRPDASEYVELPLEDAAKRLGITPAAMRKRIQRGKTIRGYQRNGAWYVLLPEDAATDTASDTRDTGPATDASTDATTAGQRQLVLFRDTILVPLIEANERQGQRIGELEREAGKLEAERNTERRRAESAESDRDRLREELEQATRARLRPLSTTNTSQRAENEHTAAPEDLDEQEQSRMWWIAVLIVVVIVTGSFLIRWMLY